MSDLIFAEKHGGTAYDVRVKRQPVDDYGEPLCTVVRYAGHKWRITETHPPDYKEQVSMMQFQDKEAAARYFLAVKRGVEQIVEAHPLPEDVARYLYERAKALREEEQHLKSRMLDIRGEKWDLNRFADRNQIQRVLWATEDSDTELAVRRLLEFNVTITIDGVTESVPLFCERATYELLGKEDGRTLLALVGKVCNMIAPGTSVTL